MNFLLVSACLLDSVALRTSAAPASPLPAEIPSVFEPPTSLKGELGSLRNVLTFESGQPVRTSADWSRRRLELLDFWHHLLGEWPPLLAQPRLEVLRCEPRDGLEQCRVRLEIAAGHMAEGWLLLPPDRGPCPAVLVPFYEPETSIGLGKAEFRAFGYDLARRGFVTLSIGSPGGDARKPEPGQAGWQPLSFLAYVAANCHTVLARHPRVDRTRIGIVGHSYGGKWAMFAACLDDRFACGVWSDPGIVFDESRPNVNYWEPWYLGREPGRAPRKPGVPTTDNPTTGAYRVLRESGRDLHELHALMAPRPFLVSGGSEDPPSRWTALNHSVAVNELLGYRDRVAMSNRAMHSPTPESNEQIYAFFQHFLAPSNAGNR